jgi:hypothetical protein
MEYPITACSQACTANASDYIRIIIMSSSVEFVTEKIAFIVSEFFYQTCILMKVKLNSLAERVLQ